MARPKIIGREILRTIGVPEFLRDEWRREAISDVGDRLYGHGLDPDLQVLKSMSPAVKRLIQIDRNVKRSEESFWRDGSESLARKLFKQLNGRVAGVSSWSGPDDDED